MKKKGLTLLAAMTMLAVGAVGGTLAWLTYTTDNVTNVFTTSNITASLTENGATKDSTTGDLSKEFKMVPGYTLSKDPKVTVEQGSEECWLFVKLEKSANFDSYLEYAIAGGWTALTGVDNVYYCSVLNGTAGDHKTLTEDKSFGVLKDDVVTVKGSVTTTDMTTAASNKPTLTVTAYASQYWKNQNEAFEVAQAWANISNPSGATQTPTDDKTAEGGIGA